MVYRVATLLTFGGLREIIQLPDSVYGEWIIYQNNIAKYQVEYFDKNSESNKKINQLISSKKETIESIILKCKTNRKVKLSFGSYPISFELKSEIKEMNLKPLPEEWLNDLIPN